MMMMVEWMRLFAERFRVRQLLRLAAPDEGRPRCQLGLP